MPVASDSLICLERAFAKVAEQQFTFSKPKMLNELPWSVRYRVSAAKIRCHVDAMSILMVSCMPQHAPTTCTSQVTLNNTIIRNLGGVAKAIDQFEKGIAAFNGSLINTLQVMKNNMYFANWMGLVMLAALVPQSRYIPVP